MSIVKDVQIYFEQNEKKKAAEKIVKEKSAVLKKHFSIGDLEKFKDIGVRVEYQRREKNITDTTKLIEKIKAVAETNPEVLDAIKEVTIEQVDEDKVMTYVARGIIKLEELEKCITTTVTGALVVKKL